MLTRRKLALLATAALITGLIAGPTIAFGGGSSDPTKTEPEPAADVAKTDADVAEPNSDADVDEPGAEHPDSGSDVHEICTGDGIGVFDGGHEGFHDFGPFEGSELSPEDRQKLEQLADEFRSQLDKFGIDGFGLDGFGSAEEFERFGPGEFMQGMEPDVDAIAEKLSDLGLTVEKTTANDGTTCLTIDGDPEEIEAALEGAFDAHFGDMHDFGGPGEFFDGFPGELPAEAVDTINAEMEALAAHFDEQGIEYEIVENGDLRVVEWDETDDNANAAAEEFFRDRVSEFPFFFEHEGCNEGGHDDETAEGDEA